MENEGALRYPRLILVCLLVLVAFRALGVAQATEEKPSPLSVADIVPGLKSGISNERMAALVKQYGVDFDLNDETEKILRTAGANGDLLLEVARNRRALTPKPPAGPPLQSVPVDVAQQINRRVRATFSVGPEVNFLIGSPRPSEFTNYDALTVTFDDGKKKAEYEFLLAKDHKQLIRVDRMNLTEGPSAEPFSSDVTQAVERQVRAFYSLPLDTKVLIGSPRSSEFPNYDELMLTLIDGEKKAEYKFLLAKDHKTLVRLRRMNLTEDPSAEFMKRIDVRGRPIRGNRDSKVIVVIYYDLQCPFCSRLHKELFPEIFKEYGDRVVFIYKDFPLAVYPWAVHAAVDANCLGARSDDAYWAYVDYLYANQDAINSLREHYAQNAELDRLAMLLGNNYTLDGGNMAACLKAQEDQAVRASIQEGDSVGVDATPTMFINGQRVAGAVQARELRAMLDRALLDEGLAVPKHNPAAAEISPQRASPGAVQQTAPATDAASANEGSSDDTDEDAGTTTNAPWGANAQAGWGSTNSSTPIGSSPTVTTGPSGACQAYQHCWRAAYNREQACLGQAGVDHNKADRCAQIVDREYAACGSDPCHSSVTH